MGIIFVIIDCVSQNLFLKHFLRVLRCKKVYLPRFAKQRGKAWDVIGFRSPNPTETHGMLK